MTMNVRPSRVSIVNGVCTLSSVLTGPDEYNSSDRSFRGKLDGIHQARALSASANSVNSLEISNDPRPGCDGNSYRKPTPSSKERTLSVSRRLGGFVSTTPTASSL